MDYGKVEVTGVYRVGYGKYGYRGVMGRNGLLSRGLWVRFPPRPPI